MREFFNGWRRKVGCVTLVMAAAFTVAWFRSQRYWDYVHVPFRGVVYSLNSDAGALTIDREWALDGDITEWSEFAWTIGAHAHRNPPNELFKLTDQVWNRYRDDRACRDQALVMSHLSIAIPFSVLSACLILWKPRKRLEADHA